MELREYHVIGGNERIIDGNKFNIIAQQSNSRNQSANSSESCTKQKKNISIEIFMEKEVNVEQTPTKLAMNHDELTIDSNLDLAHDY